MKKMMVFGYPSLDEADAVYVLREKDIQESFLKTMLNTMMIVDTENPKEFFRKSKISFLAENSVFEKFLKALSDFPNEFKVDQNITIALKEGDTKSQIDEYAALLREICMSYQEINISWQGPQWKELRKKVWKKAGVGLYASRSVREFKK